MNITKSTRKPQVEWIAEQVCGECGEGVFAKAGVDEEARCVVCEHTHPMDPINLDERERFEWKHSTAETAHRYGVTLHVVSYF